MTKIRLDQFNHSLVDRGRGRVSEILWILTKWMFFETTLPWPHRFKAALLRAFGAKIGRGVVVRPWVNIHFPWKLSVGDHCWIGEGCQILNIAPVTFEAQVALAHDVYVAAGGHDVRSATMAPKNEPILVKSGTWIASRAVIGPGVTIGEDVVVGAGAVVMKDVEPSVIVVGNPAKVLRPRVIDRP
jgi:putative colanic acid biosynthesis acetyltransferase WcaF